MDMQSSETSEFPYRMLHNFWEYEVKKIHASSEPICISKRCQY